MSYSEWPSQTHMIWYIDEIIRAILAHLPANGSEKTLARCARTSRSLSEPALDQLWFKMSGLIPVLRLLPSSFPEVRNQNGDECSFVLENDIADTEWARLSQYSRRVRKFHYLCAEGPGERLGEPAFTMLVRYASRSGTALFPNLLELSWLQFSHIAQCLPFISLSLRQVTIYVQPGHAAQASADDLRDTEFAVPVGYAGLLQVLDTRSPCVEFLSLEGVDLTDSLSSVVVFKDLRELRLGSIFCPIPLVLSLCARMPRLISLSLTCEGSSSKGRLWTNDARMGSHAESLHLSTLETLRIMGAPCDIEEILGAIDSPAFHTVALSVSVPEYDIDGWARCASVLYARFSSSLRTIRAECRRSSYAVQGRARPSSAYLQPLLRLRHLSNVFLSVSDPEGVYMTNEDIDSMAAAWPCITSLQVKFSGGPAPILPSIAALSSFARFCPDLVRIHMPLSQDVAFLQSAPRLPPNASQRWTPWNSNLRHLWIEGVRFSTKDSDIVSQFLRQCFPRVALEPMIGAGILRMN